LVMNGQLDQVCRPGNSSWALLASVAALRQEVADLRAEVERLKRENLESRQQAGYWKSRHRDALRRITALEHDVEQLEGERRQLKADLFGKSTETTTRRDRSNDLDDPRDDPQGPRRKPGQQPGNAAPKRRDSSHLPVREPVFELPPGRCVCPDCGQPLVWHGYTDDSEEIEIEVGAYRRVIRRRRYRRTCTCDGPTTILAPPAPKLIPKGRYGVSVWVEVLLDK
jgi:transposase